MTHRSAAGALAIAAGLSIVTLACGDSPGAPSTAPAPLAVISVSPATGPAAVELAIRGTSFRGGATVTVGGLTANVTAVTNSALFATAPRHPPGLVDIVVTNPGGETVTVRGAFTYIPLTITSFEPDLGYPGMDLFIGGTGFLPGRVVTFGGVRAETGPANSTTQIAFTTPDHDLGTVDIVVTNPGGESASLVGGFTYWPTPVVAVTPASVAPGGELTVTWVAPLQFTLDWIGLFKVGDHNTQFIRYIYVCCRTSGSSRLAAPTQPGQYEVRYLPHEQYFDVARSSTVTVVPGPVTATDGLTSWLTGPRQLPPPWR